MEHIGELWRHIMDGRLPILFDSGHQFRAGISPVSRYSGYDSDETGSYDLTVMAVTSDFFTQMDEKVKMGSTGNMMRGMKTATWRLYPEGVGDSVEPAEGRNYTQVLYRGL